MEKVGLKVKSIKVIKALLSPIIQEHNDFLFAITEPFFSKTKKTPIFQQYDNVKRLRSKILGLCFLLLNDQWQTNSYRTKK